MFRSVVGQGLNSLRVATVVKFCQSKTPNMLVSFALFQELFVLWQMSIQLNRLSVKHVLQVTFGGQSRLEAAINGKHKVHWVFFDINLHELIHL